MKITKNVLLSLLTTLVFSASANAAPYVIGQLGVAGMSDSNSYFKNLFDKDENLGGTRRATGRIGAGYLWDMNDALKLGVEAGFTANQNTTSDLEGVESKHYSKRYSFDVLGVADYNVTENVDLFAKAGAAYAHNEVTAETTVLNTNLVVSASRNKLVPKAVIGVGYNVTPAVNLNLSLSHEFKRTDNSAFEISPSHSAAMVGVKYTFS